jgi:hypothetical protein
MRRTVSNTKANLVGANPRTNATFDAAAAFEIDSASRGVAAIAERDMNDRSIWVLVISMMAVVIPISFGLAFWMILRLRRKANLPLSPAMDGVIVVPVQRLARTRSFFGRSENSINPRFEIMRDGVRFKVFKVDEWAFGDIDQVDAPSLPFINRISFRTKARQYLFVDVADKAKARAVLRALPPGVFLTSRAVEVRGRID